MHRLTTATPAITAAYATSAPNARMNPYSMPIHNSKGLWSESVARSSATEIVANFKE